MIKSSQAKTLSELLVNNHSFYIPPYQRPYSWDRDQREDYWNDLDDMLNGDTEKHFFGSILTINREVGKGFTNRELIDGQQRVTTTMILFCAVRDMLDAVKVGNEVASYIDNGVVRVGFPPAQSSRLILQGRDKQFFEKYILSRKANLDLLNIDVTIPKNSANESSQKKLRESYLFFIEKIWMKCEGRPEQIEQWANNFSARTNTGMIFIDVLADSLDTAYAIFEAMNNRGMPLSAADLIKNALLATIAGDDLSKQEDFSFQWNGLTQKFSDGSRLTSFIRHWWMTQVESTKVTKDNLFRQLNARISESRKVASETFDAIQKAAIVYSEISDPEREDFKSLHAYISLKTIADLRATLSYPLLMQAKISLNEDTFEDLCIKLDSLTVRYQTICKKASKNLETIFQRSANLLRKDGKASYAQVVGLLREVMPDDETVIKEFADDAPSKNIDAILRRLCFGDGEPEFEILRGKDVHVEHIMPTNLSEAWRKALSDRGKEHGLHWDRWGNLTLLNGRKNMSMQNATYAKKCELYSTSEIPLTKALPARFERWDYDSIDARTMSLATLATKVWKTF